MPVDEPHRRGHHHEGQGVTEMGGFVPQFVQGVVPLRHDGDHDQRTPPSIAAHT
jgi:hypothetical protein